MESPYDILKQQNDSWRNAHSWLDGYSDGLAGRVADSTHTFSASDYARGFTHGQSKRGGCNG